MEKLQADGKLLQAKHSYSSSKNTSIARVATDGFEGTFRRAIWPFLVVGQMFGVMPVVGVASRSLSDLHFNWKSYRTIYATIVAIIFVMYALSLFSRLFVDKPTFSISTLLFYVMNTFGIVSFLILSLHWPDLMRQWQAIESLPIFRNFVHKTAYIRRIRLITTVALLLALVEYCLFISVAIKYEKYVWITLQREPNLTYKAVIVCYLSLKTAFVWNFTDIFLMIVGIGLTTHFEVLNDELERVKLGMENMPSDYWMEIRSQFTKLCELVAVVDEKISHLVLLSFSNSLFMICEQLFESLRPWPTYFYVTYFWYSLIFLTMRAFAVSFLAARIDDESRKPISILRTIPSHLWNEETKRFFDDILCQRVALSGMRFFFVTRQFILSVVGTIITYELVLLQFNRN